MKLTPAQTAQFERKGFVFFPGLFAPPEELQGALKAA